MELHTVGMGYTRGGRAGRRPAAHRPAPWTRHRPYRYDATRHATGAVRVLGFSHANATAGRRRGGASLALLDYLARHPATAERIATKLCVRFVADEPPASAGDQAGQGLPGQRHGDRAGAAGAVHLAGVRRRRRRQGAHAVRGPRGHASACSASARSSDRHRRHLDALYWIAGRRPATRRCAGRRRTATRTWPPRGRRRPGS